MPRERASERPSEKSVSASGDGKRGAAPAGAEAKAGTQAGEREQPRETWLQIAVTWMSGLLILAIVAYLVWEGTRPFTPAGFQTTVQEVRPFEDRFHVRLRVRNVGGQSVESLEVMFQLLEGEEVVASSSAVLDWLPERSSRELVLIVPVDPADYTQVVRFGGYQIP